LIADFPKDFVSAIDRLLEDKTLYQKLQVAGRQLIRQTFSWRAQNAILSSILFGSDVKPSRRLRLVSGRRTSSA